MQCSGLSFRDEKQSLYHIIKSSLDKRTDKCIKINTGKENKSAHKTVLIFDNDRSGYEAISIILINEKNNF